MPFLIDRLKNVPISGFRLSNDDFEYLEVDNLHVNVEDILPDKIKIWSSMDTDITIKNFENPVKSETVVKFFLSGIRPTFENFDFRFKRRGMLGLKDEGRASLDLNGKGLSIRIDFEVDVDTESRVLLGDFTVYVSVDSIDLDIKEADNKFLLNMMTGLFAPRVKYELEKAILQRVGEMGKEWALTINKRVLSALPLTKFSAVIKENVVPAVMPAQLLNP